MPDPLLSRANADYLLRAAAIMAHIEEAKAPIADIARATRLPTTTILRTAAIMMDEQLIDAHWIAGRLHLSIRRDLPIE